MQRRINRWDARMMTFEVKIGGRDRSVEIL
jgi:hypothetical protein